MKPVARPLAIARQRLLVIAAFFVIFVGVIAVTLIKVSLWHDTNSRDTRAITQRKDDDEDFGMPEHEVRAEIRDRNGNMLATSLRMASVFADPKDISDPDDAAKRIAPLLPKESVASLKEKLTRKSRFVWLKRNITPREQYEINKLGIPGIDFRYEERRIYPNDELTAHVVGYTDRDDKGIAGVEKYFDKELANHPEPLFLSIDSRIQHIVRRETLNAMERFSAIGGIGMMMNVKTGEVVAMVSVPDFNPNNMSSITGTGDGDPRFNRAALGVYEMGSTFKSLTIAEAFELNKVNMDSTVDARSPIKIGRFTIDDYKGEYRVLSVPEVFVYSSNIGTVKIVDKIGTPKFKEFLTRIGMTKPAPIELPEIGRPIVPNPWRDVSTMTIAFGHGIAVSAAQLLRAESAMVNGGILITPTLIKKEFYGEPQGDRVISKQSSRAMQQLLRLNVLAGTGKNADVKGYVVGGKTGTTNKAVGGGYSESRLISSFIGAFPMDDPQYAVLIMIDEPKGRKDTYGYATGGWVAAPAVAKIIAGAAPILGIAPRNENAPELLDKLTPEGMNLDEFIARTKGH